MIAYSNYETDPRVMREAEAAVEAGFEVDFLALRRPGALAEEVIRSVRVIRLNQAKYQGDRHLSYILEYLLFFFRCFLKTTVLFIKRRYKAIHVNNMPDFLVFSTIIPRLFGTKVILDIHDPVPETFVSKFKPAQRGFVYWALLWQERLSAAYCSRVITVHHLVKHAILVKHGIAPDSIEVVANFADDVFSLRKSFSIEGKIRFVFHGSILERAGLQMLATSLANVRHKDRISLKIIGEGDFSQALKGIIESLQLGDIIDFDNRNYPAHSVPERIGDCNVGLVPLQISSVSNYALPGKLTEYISLGLPVVSVRNEAISYYLSEEDCMFFEWNDPWSLTAIFDRIAENPAILLRYRERSLALRESLSWTSEKRKYVALLCQLTGVGQNQECVSGEKKAVLGVE